jgi:hypothetical protein
MENIQTRQEKKGRQHKEHYNQKSLRIQEAIREKTKQKQGKNNGSNKNASFASCLSSF